MRILGWIGIIFVCFVSGGATCARRQAPLPFPPPPVVLQETPSLEEVASVVNRTGSISQLSSNSASVRVLSMPKVPRLSATLNLEREQKFRLRANLPIWGAGMDMGSNDELFWFEVPEGMSKTLYFARHDQYQQQLHRAILPVDPTWVMDALGLVQINPGAVVEGPILREDGKLQIRETMSMPDGVYQRVCLIEPRAGYVTDQFLYSPAGNPIAQCHAADHVYYEEQQCALPHRVEFSLSPAVGPPLSMRIEIGSYTINQLLSGDPQLFTMPVTASQAVDLTTLAGAPAMPLQPSPLQPSPLQSSPLQSSPLPSGTLGAGANLPPAATSINYSTNAAAGYPLRGTLR